MPKRVWELYIRSQGLLKYTLGKSCYIRTMEYSEGLKAIFVAQIISR